MALLDELARWFEIVVRGIRGWAALQVPDACEVLDDAALRRSLEELRALIAASDATSPAKELSENNWTNLIK